MRERAGWGLGYPVSLDQKKPVAWKGISFALRRRISQALCKCSCLPRSEWPGIKGRGKARCPWSPWTVCSLHKVPFTTLRKDENSWQPGKTGWVALFFLLFKEIIVGDVLRLEEWG